MASVLLDAHVDPLSMTMYHIGCYKELGKVAKVLAESVSLAESQIQLQRLTVQTSFDSLAKSAWTVTWTSSWPCMCGMYTA